MDPLRTSLSGEWFIFEEKPRGKWKKNEGKKEPHFLHPNSFNSNLLYPALYLQNFCLFPPLCTNNPLTIESFHNFSSTDFTSRTNPNRDLEISGTTAYHHLRYSAYCHLRLHVFLILLSSPQICIVDRVFFLFSNYVGSPSSQSILKFFHTS